jgi:hypothetical protein
VNEWLAAALAFFKPEIETVLHLRDAKIAAGERRKIPLKTEAGKSSRPFRSTSMRRSRRRAEL